MQRKAKIICTIGPATIDKKMMRGLISRGMNCARLNFSHGTHEFHAGAIKTIREEAKRLRKTVAIMQDLQGIKIRTGTLKGGSIQLKKGQAVTIKPGKGQGDENTIYINYAPLIEATEVGHPILLDDGLIRLEVTGIKSDSLQAVVKAGGLLGEKKGVNLPGLKPLDISFTEKDAADLRFGLRMGVDYIALSFVRTAKDVQALRSFLKKENYAKPVIAKIETRQGLKNIDSILPEVEGIMVARGDLGVEIPPEDVPIAQKELIVKANKAGKLVIVATEMLESMTRKSRPTRAETTDVSNAVLDGADDLMLSQETSIGQYPLESVEMMDRIIQETERTFSVHSRYAHKGTFSEAVAQAAKDAAESVGARYIVAFTQSGYTAVLLSMMRPRVDIAAFSPSEEVMRKMALYWGVVSRKIKKLRSMDAQFREVEKKLLSEKLVKNGDTIVITAGTPNVQGTTSIVKLAVVGQD